MGVLDDAIREHLELKRRGGADPADVERLEREAFGAKEQEAPPNGAVQPDSPEPSEPMLDPGGGHVDVSDEPHPDEHVHEPAAVGDPLVDHEPHAEQPPAPPAEREPVEQPTRQFTAAELDDAQRPHHADEPAGSEPADEDEVHDELEETPDFLQETPEHDRLWFEQKPPRDFDF